MNSVFSFGLKRTLVRRLYAARKFVWPILNGADWCYRLIRGKTHYPPLSARQLVSGTFWGSLSEFDREGGRVIEMMREFVDLSPSQSVLDVGCGCGRAAIPLLRYLDASTSYQGGDVDLGMVKWCQDNIARRHSNARFFHIDVRNSFYNPKSTSTASEYRFPIEDGSIDLVYLGSVFTHMLTRDVQRYLEEFHRVLKPNGRVIFGMFIISDSRIIGPSISMIKHKFPFEKDGYWLACEEYPELDIAYKDSVAMEMVARANLTSHRPIVWGNWAGNEGICYQDVMILKKIM